MANGKKKPMEILKGEWKAARVYDGKPCLQFQAEKMGSIVDFTIRSVRNGVLALFDNRFDDVLICGKELVEVNGQSEFRVPALTNHNKKVRLPAPLPEKMENLRARLS